MTKATLLGLHQTHFPPMHTHSAGMRMKKPGRVCFPGSQHRRSATKLPSKPFHVPANNPPIPPPRTHGQTQAPALAMSCFLALGVLCLLPVAAFALLISSSTLPSSSAMLKLKRTSKTLHPSTSFPSLLLRHAAADGNDDAETKKRRRMLREKCPLRRLSATTCARSS